MKNVLTFGLLIALAITFTSCKKDKDDAPAFGANVKVIVENWPGDKKDDVTVYMYKDKEVDSSTKKEDAVKQSVTDSDGVAYFKLNFTELDFNANQTTLYFAVFYTVGSEDYVAGSTGITLERGDEKEVKITIPL